VKRGVLLRRAVMGDLAPLAALEQAASPDPWSEGELKAELAREAPDAVLVLAGRAGVVAYCAYRLALDEMQVMNLAVMPEARRRGLGGYLLRLALARAERAGARRSLLEVRAGNEAARALYAGFGFALLGRRARYYANPAEDALVLVREAGPSAATLN
jgi:ribosomal-protein-alanine acetyltransferase